MLASSEPQPKSPSRAIVFGSLNLDYVIRAARAPGAGETVEASRLSLQSGGKGGNQAVALARCGATATMIGCVGDDAAGQSVLRALEESGVDVGSIRVVPGVPSGSAFIIVDDLGENRIMIVPGSNAELGSQEFAELERCLMTANALLLQFEVPIEQVIRAARSAHSANVPVILDPAPARPFPRDLEGLIDILTPNESEAAVLSGHSLDDDESAARCTTFLRTTSKARVVIVKRGSKGIIFDSGSGPRVIAAPKVEVRDTTAAGDSFNGALGAALCNGSSLEDAIGFGIAAGALSVTRRGSQESIPTQAEVREVLARASGVVK